MYITQALGHYIYPRQSNNQKAKLLHTSTLLLMTFMLFAYQLMLQALPITGVRILGYAANIPANEVINLTNIKRSEAGLSSLIVNNLLTQAAQSKARDMLDKDYWSHVSPDGTEPWIFFTDAGYKYRYAGENLARDFSSPGSVVEAWMASPSHKENLLSSKYNEIGIAVIEGDLAGVDTTLIVQLFGTQLGTSSESIPEAQAKTEASLASQTEVLQGHLEVTPTAITFTPTPILSPTTQPTAYPEMIVGSSPPSSSTTEKGIFLSPFDTTRAISGITILLLLGVLVVDGIVTHKTKNQRIAGRNFAHFAFLGMILAILLIASAGEIL